MRRLTTLELVRFVRAGLGPDNTAIGPGFEAAQELERRAELEAQLHEWQRRTHGRAERFQDGSWALRWTRSTADGAGFLVTATAATLEGALLRTPEADRVQVTK